MLCTPILNKLGKLEHWTNVWLGGDWYLSLLVFGFVEVYARQLVQRFCRVYFQFENDELIKGTNCFH